MREDEQKGNKQSSNSNRKTLNDIDKNKTEEI